MSSTPAAPTAPFPSNIEIAQRAKMRPVIGLAQERLGIPAESLEPYGHYKAKVSLEYVAQLKGRPEGKLILVSAISPTPAGEGKTTTTVGLGDALNLLGHKAIMCLREPALGPVFGVKGGAAGGGYSQVVPMEDINLHFTGDFAAIALANNLLAAIIDNHIYHGNQLGFDVRRITWRRVVDVNDRALRQIVVGLGGRPNGYPRETGFDITAASEVMAIMAVARDLQDLRRRIGAITAAYSYDGGRPITAEDLGAAGAMTVLLKDALKPNLVQTLEGQPVLMHCGPFANIAHGNNSLIADLIGMKLGDYVVTESGFGSDMGMEKFFDIVCRFGKLIPSASVLVTTVRAIKHHGGVADDPRVDRAAGRHAIELGMANVRRHLQIIKGFGVPAVVAVNRRPGDTNEEVELVRALALEAGAYAAEINDGFSRGGVGVADLAEAVVGACEQPNSFRYTYEDEAPIQDKIEAVARKVYGAKDVYFYPEAEQKIAQFSRDGLGHFPVCMAKTHLSLSSDPLLLGAPENFTLPVRDVRAYTGAGWLVPLCGDIQQMPGLGTSPAALNIDIDAEGRTVGLF